MVIVIGRRFSGQGIEKHGEREVTDDNQVTSKKRFSDQGIERHGKGEII